MFLIMEKRFTTLPNPLSFCRKKFWVGKLSGEYLSKPRNRHTGSNTEFPAFDRMLQVANWPVMNL